MHLHQSGEDYLEAILELRQERGMVRSIDVAQKLGFSKPSVSRAMAILRADGYITMEQSGAILLTEGGEQVAKAMLERHHMLTDCLIRLGVSPWVAAKDACRMEHALSEETFECLKRHMGLSEEAVTNTEE